MKKFFFYPILSLIFLVLLLVLGVIAAVFFRPEWVLNPENLSWALGKQSVFKSWSWKKSEMKFDWIQWDKRHIHGHFKNFCFEVDQETLTAKTCLDEVSWNFHFFIDGFAKVHVETLSPLRLLSSETMVKLMEGPPAKKEEFSSIDPGKYWKMLWSPLVPDMEIIFQKITLHKEKEFVFNIDLKKEPENLRLEVLNFILKADPKKFEVFPPSPYKLPMKPVLGTKLHLYDFLLKGVVSPDEIDLLVKGELGPIHFNLTGSLDLPIVDDPAQSKFRKNFFKTLKAQVTLKDLQKQIKRYGPKGYSSLPAPLNVMNGDFITDVYVEDLEDKDLVKVLAKSHLDLKSPKQVVDVVLDGEVPLNVMTFKPEAILVGIDFRKVMIELPRLSKKSLPPQFTPDSRFVNTPFNKKEKKASPKEPLDLDLHLEALNKKALHLRTNLLDEDLRLNFDINIKKGEMQKSFVKVLPLKTTVFKRPIHVDYTRIDFNPPLEPVLDAIVKFPLPTYKVTLKLEGPLSSPRYVFTSEPPLPQNDIYAVLLFGRPLDDLDPNDKNSAQKTNQILSQGILSLGVLYFLAGSPVEYVGYDAESKEATASFGVDDKTSLRVGGSGQGVNSTGVRRSLGKGWYLDTSVEKTQLSQGDAKSYGVMLERIIAY